MSSLLLNTLANKNKGRPPIWLMRQAGRYMPSYRKLREKYSFIELCLNPDLATQVTMMPIQQLDVDAAILFSDILLIAGCAGLDIQYEKEGAPHPKTYLNPNKIDLLPTIPVEEVLGPVYSAIKSICKETDKPLIGFSGGPWTTTTYLLDSKHNKSCNRLKQWLYEDPLSLHQWLQYMTNIIKEHVLHQIRAGAKVIQIFETWAGILSPSLFQKIMIPYLQQICNAVKQANIPIIFFMKGGIEHYQCLESIAPTGISYDWMIPIESVLKTIDPNIALQGNLDPHILHAPISCIEQQAIHLLKATTHRNNFIFNLGHGLLPTLSPDHVKALVDTVKSYEMAL